MSLLKILYIIWSVFFGIIILYYSLYRYFSDEEFFEDTLKTAFFIYSYPLLPYLSYLFLKKTVEFKNIFLSSLIYFSLFLFFFLYFYLFFFICGAFLFYIIAIGIYTVSFLAISIKFRKNFSIYFSLGFCISLYCFLFFLIFIVGV